MRKIGFLIADGSSFAKQNPENVCQQLKELGYSAIEWTTDFLNPFCKSSDEISEIVKLSNSYGLEVGEVVVQKDLIVTSIEEYEKNTEYIIKCIESYSKAGIKTINLFTGPRPWIENAIRVGYDIDYSEAWNRAFSSFDKFVVAAEKHNMNLAVEGVWGHLCRDFFSTWFLITHYASNNLGVNYDPSHDILAGNTDVGWTIRQWGKNRIKNIHLKDAVGWYMNDTVGQMKDTRFVFPIFGEGKVNWKSFITALDEIGYDGAMSVEFESFDYLNNVLDGDMYKAAEISINNIRKVFGE